ncbi:16S rRNA (adenine(1518)-N(6)/adenine(1519)-N(6))-dimethyltransferase RsmA [Streptomyces sp. AJS327]|uniref:16S rRNA (adenine(1518)-N(6)/adenine(1519)-N(6))- dimethyltransferase RsmA n=1 Tax=Streptomyces sp. AJS327 TaxID=2545265 RepID=UPI0015DDA838|nr:16S rRNA (adenine(1518)-N(6)/adenine(1519)-N(6))-dimethyltransferase RsmA [Streptomyces sp. AJS327]MBA0049370.1 16S rRNA (adenine(1518)-N(6)/adenine(1519)-N(6))-dimethyltransferase RsmA [Streptomyces sp. AJS327]
MSDESAPEPPSCPPGPDPLLGAADVRELAQVLGLRPTKQRGQNFVIDANTVRRIIRAADVRPDDVVVEVGPGLGSLTLALLESARRVTAVEVDEVLAAALPSTVRARAPWLADSFELVHADALRITELPGPEPTALVANLPYNVAVPVLLHMLATFPSLRRALVMVQAEVADRLAAAPGSKVYGVPSVKAAWYCEVRRAGAIGRNVFWPAPNVDSGLVALERRDAPPVAGVSRDAVFAVVDAAFAQRRKTLRSALAGWAGSAARAEEALRAAGVDPRARGEALSVEQFAAIALHHPATSAATARTPGPAGVGGTAGDGTGRSPRDRAEGDSRDGTGLAPDGEAAREGREDGEGNHA